jgi:hypothetical protein
MGRCRNWLRRIGPAQKGMGKAWVIVSAGYDNLDSRRLSMFRDMLDRDKVNTLAISEPICNDFSGQR